MIALFSKVSNVLLELFYPLHCDGCDVALFEKSHLCQECWGSLKPLAKPFCEICSCKIVADARCPNCADRKLHFVAGVSAFQYDGLMRTLLYRLKYGRDQRLKKVMGELLVPALQDERLQGIFFEAIVPVPLHPRSEREREFNQAQLLACEVALHYQRPLKSLLQCLRPASPQARSDRKKRMEHRKNLFSLRLPQQLSGNYLLVDDVLTTGATLDACAKALLEAGAEGVWAITVAR
ncbi:MAG: ComF family protein [Chthoniobacterales bacterium]|nr:ComF family protein [Chthoniobacterales bacterium]